MKLLHIIATPRGEKSSTLAISNALISEISTKHPELEIQVLNPFFTELPKVIGGNVESKYGILTGKGVSEENKSEWQKLESLIDDFLSADIYIISVPMWNFTIPHALKSYIDCIVQPGYLFQYNEQGIPEGLAKDKKMVCVCTTGGDYSEGSPMHSMNFVEPYLKGIFGFIGVTDSQFITAGPMDYTPEIKAMVITGAVKATKELVAQL